MELGSTTGDGVTGVSQDSHGRNVYFSAAGTAHHQHLRGQGQLGANFISAMYASTNRITSSMHYAANDQRCPTESSIPNGEKAIVAGDTTAQDNLFSAEAGGTGPNPSQQSNNNNQRKPRKKKQTPIPKPGSTLEIISDNLVRNAEQQQQQHHQQQQESFYPSGYMAQPLYSNSHQLTSDRPDIIYAHNHMHQRAQMNQNASLPPLMNPVGRMYQQGIDEEKFNDVQNSFHFSSSTGLLIYPPHGGIYSHPQVFNGHMREVPFTQQFQQQQPFQNNSLGTLLQIQQFQNFSQLPNTAVMNERISNPIVSAHNEVAPVRKEEIYSAVAAQPSNLSCTKKPAENSIEDVPSHSASPTLTEASELKESEIRSKPLAPARPEKRLPFPPVPIPLRDKGGKNGKKGSRPKKNKVFCTKKQKSKNMNKRSKEYKVRDCRSDESEEGKTNEMKSRRNQHLVTDDNDELSPCLSVQLDAEDANLVVSHDDSRHRYCNPLLEMPPFPGLRIFNKPYSYYELMLQSLNSNVCSADPANASEIWSISQIYFPRPDTFPLSYYAGLLGFRLLSRQKEEQHAQQEMRESSMGDDMQTEITICQEQEHEIQENISQETLCSTQILGDLSKESDVFGVEPEVEHENESELDVDWEVDKILTDDLKVTRILSLNDPAMFIPPPIPHPVDGFEIDDSTDVDDVDPVWRNIKQYYKGYSKNCFIPFTVVNAKNLPIKTEISADIIKLAKELELLPLLDGSSISLRFATSKDEDVLREAAFKKCPEYNGFRRLKDAYEVSSALKSPGEFIIVAFHVRNESEVFLGYIHYCFHWYKLQGDAAQQISEALMYLNDVYCSTELAASKVEKDALEVILECQAFHHARSCGIFYGMMHVSRGLSTRYINLYRMTELPAPDGSDSSMSLLAFALSKSNHSYALRMLHRMLATNSLQESGRPLKPCLDPGYRMLIRIPNHEGINDISSTLKDRKVAVNTEPASSVRDNLRDKSVIVRLNTSESVVSYSSSSELLDEASKCESIPWSVVRLFPQTYSIQSRPAALESIIIDPEIDEVQTELLKKQKMLKELENELEPRLISLLRQVLKERVLFTSTQAKKKRAAREECMENYRKVLDRNKAAALAWQLQQEQDMDAVCDICNDGEVSVNNQILFCESCNVAVHQVCYNIETVPTGDWFCRACRYFNRHEIRQPQAEAHGLTKKANSEPLPISCELCPRRQGAFVRTQNTESPEVAKWVHVVCAKWQGFKYLDIANPDCVESVVETKYHFRSLGISCFLCKGMRGAYHKCDTENCDRYLHMTCARSVGSCTVVHGETPDGLLQSADAWKLKCPEHSVISSKDIPDGSLTVEELVESAKHFPSDPLPPPPPPAKPSAKNFGRMQLKEREEYLKNDDFEQDLIREANKKREGGICEICYKWDECTKVQEGDGVFEAGILWCNICGISVHKECYVEGIDKQRSITRANFVCAACNWRKHNSEDSEVPQCNICNMKSGPLHEAYARPTFESKWKKDSSYKKSLFGRKIWIHSLCALWSQVPLGEREEAQYQRYDCSHIVMSNGFSHIHDKWVCALCCRHDKLKIKCSFEHCRYRGMKNPYRFHLTCANQAGFQLTDEARDQEINLLSFCFVHKSVEFSIRSQLEDFLELEKSRAGRNLPKGKGMSLGYVARLLQMSVKILAVFGWAWRWAEWWVEDGEKYRSLNESGGQEVVTSSGTPESRCADARRCRLAALGAALRNRDYDKEKGDDRVALDRALKAVLHTQSLVGPLKEVEIDFIAEWLGRAYRSKDRLLGFGDDKIPVSEFGESLHSSDLSPKFELGCRPLPGKQILEKGEIFEAGVNEMDDFLQPNDPHAEVRGKKGRITKKVNTEKKVENICTRVRFSKRSLNQSPCNEKEIQSEQITKRSRLEADDPPRTGRGIAVDKPDEKNTLLPTDKISKDGYPLPKRGDKPRQENIRMYFEPRRSKREKNAVNLSGFLENTLKNMSCVENETSKTESDIELDLLGKNEKSRPMAETSASEPTGDVIPSKVGKNMNTKRSHIEMTAFVEVHSESDSDFVSSHAVKKDSLDGSSSTLMETARKRGRPKKAVTDCLRKSLVDSPPQTNLPEEVKTQQFISRAGGSDVGSKIRNQSEGLGNESENDSYAVETRDKITDETKPNLVAVMVRPKTRRSYGSLPESGQRKDADDANKGRKKTLRNAKKKRPAQEPDKVNSLTNTQGGSVRSMVTTRSRSDIHAENEKVANQHLSPLAKLNRELEVYGIPRKKNKTSRLTSHS